MKKRLTPIITVSIAIILIGSIAYAADRKRQTKQVDQPTVPNHEEEVLMNELLQSVGDHEKKSTADGDIEKIVVNKVDKKTDPLKPGKLLL